MLFSRKGYFWSFAVAALTAGLLYGTHFIFCQRSTLQFLDLFFVDSDMHANLMWARGIREQGWLNPAPYHPWNHWMQTVAPYSQWVEWWGGQQIFQQPPPVCLSLELIRAKTSFDARLSSRAECRNLYFHRALHGSYFGKYRRLVSILAGDSLCAVLRLFMALFA